MALVSGASRGIGAEIARQLASDHGFVVFAGARDPDDVEEAEGIIPIELDVTDQDEVYSALELIGSDPGHLDALVNNAGVYGDPVGAADYDLDRAHEVLEVNTFGPWRLIEAFLPLLHRSSQPRIVNVSSGAGQLSDMNGGRAAYRVSKAALNALTTHARLGRGRCQGQRDVPGMGPHRHGRLRGDEVGRGGRGHRRLAGDASGRWPNRWLLPQPRANTVVRWRRPRT